MKLKLIETALLLGIVCFIMSCDPWSCLTDDASISYSCVNGTLWKTISSGGIFSDETNLPLYAGTCKPSDNGSGGPLPSPSTAQPAPSPSSGASANFRSVSPKDVAPASGGFPRVSFLNLPFMPLAPSSAGPGACDPADPDLLIVSHLDGTLARGGTCPPVKRATILLAPLPLEVAVTPDGSTAIVTSFQNAVNFVDLSSNKVTTTLPTPGYNPSGIAISPDDKTAYVTSFNASTPAVLVVDIASRSITKTISLNQQYPHSVALTPDGAQLYIAYACNDQVDVMDTLTGTVFKSLTIGAPYGIDFSPNGAQAYIASAGTGNPNCYTSGPGSLLVLDTATFKVVKTYTVGSLPNDVRVNYAGTTVTVTNYLSQTLSLVNLRTGQVSTSSALPGPLMGLVRVE